MSVTRNEAMRSAARAYQNECDCCSPETADEVTDEQVRDWLYEEDLDVTLLEAAIYAWRNGDHLYMNRQFDRLAMPVIERERQS